MCGWMVVRVCVCVPHRISAALSFTVMCGWTTVRLCVPQRTSAALSVRSGSSTSNVRPKVLVAPDGGGSGTTPALGPTAVYVGAYVHGKRVFSVVAPAAPHRHEYTNMWLELLRPWHHTDMRSALLCPRRHTCVTRVSHVCHTCARADMCGPA
eukprot:353417-Chlamydomonas_euryale.AAC.3